MYKKVFVALNKLQWLICHYTKSNQTKLSISQEYEQFSNRSTRSIIVILTDTN